MKHLLLIFALSASMLCQTPTVSSTIAAKPTPIDHEEKMVLVRAAEQSRAVQLKLERQRLVLAISLFPVDSTSKLAQLRLQLAQLDAEVTTLKLQQELNAANEDVQMKLAGMKKKHGAEGCDPEPGGLGWKCPDPPPPPPKVTMCGDKSCAEKIEEQEKAERQKKASDK